MSTRANAERPGRLLRVLAVCVLASPAIAHEQVPPTEAADTAAIVATIQAGVKAAYAAGQRPAMRDAHAKAHGCVRAELTVLPDLPAELREGVFAASRTYPAWIRFSNGNGAPHPDATGDGRGMAIKLMDVPGRKLLPAETTAQTQDFVMINHPVFFVRNVADYRSFTALSTQKRSAEFFANRAHEKAIVAAITSKTIGEVFELRYYSMTPYLLGSRPSKFSARPVDCASGKGLTASATVPPSNDPDYLRTRMQQWLDERDACFHFAVQLQTDPTTQPVEDPTVVWDDARAPFTDVAKLRIPRQTFTSDAQRAFCENLSFTPWHALPEHRPIGGINRVRRPVYEAISKLRHELNGAPRHEPVDNEALE